MKNRPSQNKVLKAGPPSPQDFDARFAIVFTPSPQATQLNPLDIMYPELPEQIVHVIRLMETLLGRQFSGDQLGNHQKS